MTNETMIEILKRDYCTEKEAEKHLKNGTVIYDLESWEYELNNENSGFEKEWTAENIKAGKVADISYVTYEGEGYIIVYVL